MIVQKAGNNWRVGLIGEKQMRLHTRQLVFLRLVMKRLMALYLSFLFAGCSVSYHPDELAVQTAADFLDAFLISPASDYGYSYWHTKFKLQVSQEKWVEGGKKIAGFAKTIWVKADSYDVSEAEKGVIKLYFL
jgi:hypothetical protein